MKLGYTFTTKQISSRTGFITATIHRRGTPNGSSSYGSHGNMFGETKSPQSPFVAWKRSWKRINFFHLQVSKDQERNFMNRPVNYERNMGSNTISTCHNILVPWLEELARRDQTGRLYPRVLLTPWATRTETSIYNGSNI